MKHKTISLLLAFGIGALASVSAQTTIPGTVTFRTISGDSYAVNSNTGTQEKISDETLLSEGFTIKTSDNSFLEAEFSNGVSARISPRTHVKIQAFSRSDSRVASSARQATPPVLKLELITGDMVINANRKSDGELIIQTPISETSAENTKAFVSFGTNASGAQKISRSINLGTGELKVSTLSNEAFVDSELQTSYIFHQPGAEPQSKTLASENTVIVLSEPSTQTVTHDPYTNAYSSLPYDLCLTDELSSVADSLLNPLGQENLHAIVLWADKGASFLNTRNGLTGELVAGMKVSPGTILRTPNEGRAAIMFPNDGLLTLDPASIVFFENILAHPLVSNVHASQITRVGLRIEGGRMIANSINTGSDDQFFVISPLDQHLVGSNSIVSIEFLAVSPEAFQTISRNETPSGLTGISTTVVTSERLTYTDETSTFIEYRAESAAFAFVTPPGFTHVTESAVIPPTYAFIDRTIAFAAPVIPGPTAPVTPGNPGNTLQNTSSVTEEPPSL